MVSNNVIKKRFFINIKTQKKKKKKMKKRENVLVIHEKDLNDKEITVIGVASSVKHAKIMIDNYYGEYNIIMKENVLRYNIEYTKIIEVKSKDKPDSRYEITLVWFTLNE